MADPDDLYSYPRSLTCAICDDPACTGEHSLADPWQGPSLPPEPCPLPLPEPAPSVAPFVPPFRRDLE